MASLLNKIDKELKAAGIAPRTEAAKAFIRQQIAKTKIPANRSNVLNDASRVASKAFIGKMYFFHYDAKHKDTLPVWDKFPLVIPMEYYSDGFLALNLHYLDAYSRLALLDKLHDFINNDKYDDTTTFNLSYDLLAGARRYSLINGCVKRYLHQHIVSSMIYIEPKHWETAIFLPTQKMVYRS